MAPDRELLSVSQNDLASHQLRFITYGSSKNAQVVGEWSCQQSGAARVDHVPDSGKLTSPAAPSNLRHAVVRISQAPACWRRPVTQKKPFQPPFKIRLDLRYTGQLQLPVRVEAIALPEQSAEHLVKQQGDGVLVPTQLSQQNELENASISSCIQTHDRDNDDTTEKSFSEDLEFTELRFSKSSRMNRRWILFTCRLGWDMLYCLYCLPTIVLSRKTDQYEKACTILRQRTLIDTVAFGGKHQLNSPKYFSSPVGDMQQDWKSAQHIPGLITNCSQPFLAQHHEPCASPFCVPQDVVQQYIWDKYSESGLKRPLTDRDMVALGLRAGLVSFSANGMATGGGTDSRTWLEFQAWFDACLRSLKLVDHLWSATDIVRICSFTVDRNFAEHLLSDSANGTFVVRLCSEPGAFAISTKVHVAGMAPEVKHVLIDALDLQKQSLEFWVSANDWALNLLDVQSGDYVPKALSFGRQLLGIANSPSDLGSCFHQSVQVLSPSPPLSSNTTVEPGTPTMSLEGALSEETVGHSITMSMSPAILPHHLVQRQYQSLDQPQGVSHAQDDFSCSELQSLVNVTGLTPQELRALKCDFDRREMLLKKRASTTSIDTTICLGDRSNKRRMLSVAEAGFGADSGLLWSVPGYAINQSVGIINEIRDVNV